MELHIGCPLPAIAFVISWPISPPKTAHTGLNSLKAVSSSNRNVFSLANANLSSLPFAFETVSAFLSEGDDELKEEVADLVFHLLILLEHSNVEWNDVLTTLKKRMKND